MEQNQEVHTPEKKSGKIPSRRVHMANERTFLAWIRTSIAIMAFGFVVEKFSLFVTQMGYYLGKEPAAAEPEYSSLIAVLLVGLGVLMGALAFVRYKAVERQIDENTYRSSPLLTVLLMIAMITIGMFLMLYLVHTM